ncbi:MAG: cobalamin biosynthesis protein CobD [Candidatus Omnitrophica bacterium]|nr:cobalamin biosynthesis protein CobD [Candidatus Omnitrophota bacterium]
MLLIISSYITDLVIGDPEWFPHPVRGMGGIINFLDNRLKRSGIMWLDRAKGIMTALTVIGISASLSYLFLLYAKRISPIAGNIAWVFLGYLSLSVKDLRVKSRAILKELGRNSLDSARKELSKIVGRDTQDLDKEKIITATIESIAENINDGIIAPLFYLILGGPVLAITYKSINTLDSMVGYRNKRYFDFGWFSAKLDDIANFIPARISGLLISLSSTVIKRRFRESYETMLRDGNKHPSPNSGISEAAMAGALGIRLGGPSTYQGRVSNKPYLGKDVRPISPSLINEALAISLVSSLLIVIIGAFIKWLI